MFHLQTEVNYEFLCGTKFPGLLPLHTNLSHEQHLNDCCTVYLHVTPNTSVNSYDKTKCLINPYPANVDNMASSYQC